MDKNYSSVKVEKLKELMPDVFTTDGKIDMSKLEQQLGNENLANSKSGINGSTYEVLFHKNPLPMWVYDIESLAFLEVNEAAILNYGYSREEFLSMTIKDIRPTEDMPLLLEKLKPENYTDIDSDILRHLKKNGEIIYVQISAHFIDFEGRKARHIVAHDITQERSWEKALHQRDYWLTESQKAGRIGSYSFKITEGYWKSSETLDEIFGIEKTEQKSFEEWANLIHPDNREEMLRYFDEYVLTGKKKFDKEYRVLRPDGATLWVWGIGNLTFDENGRPLKMMGTIQDITERKLAENALKQAQQNFELFFNTIDDFLFVLDQTGDILHYNETVAKRLGYTDDELRGQSVMMVHPEDRRAEAACIVSEMLSGKKDACPIPIITKSGEQIPVETRITHGEWNGMPVLFGVTKDISKLQFSEEKFSKAFQLNSSACGLTILEDGTYVEVNKAFCTLFGYEKEEVIGKNPLDLGIFSTATRRAIQKYQTQDGKFANVPAELKTKNGELKQVLLSAENIIIHNISYRYTEVNDITDQVHLINALRGSEEKYRFLAENATDVIWSMDLSGKIDYISPSVFNLRGYTASETKNQSFSEIFAKDSITKATMLLATKAKLILSGERPEPVNIQLEQICKNGTTIWTEMLISATYNENGQFVQFQGVTRNIQEQKIAEDSLRASEERFRSIIEISPIPMALNNNELIITYLNKSFIEIFGYTLNDISKVSDWWSNAYPDKKYRNEVIEKWNAELNRSKESNSAFTPMEVIIRCKDGRDKVVIVSASAISESYDGDHLVVLYDITEQRNASDRLFKSEEQFRLLAENSTDVIWTMDMEGKYTYVSPAIEKLRGYTPDELTNQTFVEAIAPNSMENTNAMFHFVRSKILSGEKVETQTLTIELLHKDGSTLWSEIVIDVVFDNEGNFLHILGVTRNISERKEAQDALRTREEQLNTLVNATPDFICFKDGEGRWQITNETGIELFNLSEIDYIGKTDQEITALSPESYKDTHRGCIESDARAWANKKTYQVEETIHKPDGISIVLDVIKVPLFHEDGSRKGLVILGRDVTERKLTADLIEESRARYRTLSDASFESIFVSEKGVCIEQNKTAELVFGYTHEEALGRYGTEWIIPEDREMVMQNMVSGYEKPYEATALRKDGTTFPCILKGKMMKYKGKDVRITSLTDISTLKKTEIELRESREKYRLIFHNSPFGIISFDTNGKITACNDKFVHIIGSSQKAIVGLNMLDLPDQRVVVSTQKVLHGETDSSEGIYQSVTADKSTPIRAIYAPIIDTNGEIYGGVGIIEDITERVNAQKAQYESETKYRSLVDYSPDTIVIHVNGEIVFVNEAGIQLVGAASLADVLGKSVLEFVHPDSRAFVIERMKQVLRAGAPIPLAEEVFLRLDGSTVEVDVKSMPIQYGDKRAAQLIIRDITERKAAEKTIIESEKRYKALFATSPSGITIIDEDGIIIEINQEITNITGYLRDELVGQPIHLLGLPEREPLVRDNIRRILAGETLESEVVTIKKDGTQVFFHLREAAITLPNGQQGILSVSNDITSRKEIEIELDSKMNDLLQFQRLTTGRELAMIELKKEINNLLINIGKSPKYKIVE